MGKHEATTKLEDTRIDKVIFTTFGILLCLTILSILALINTHVSAETTTMSDSKSATASVNVNAACTMSTTGNVDSDTDTNTHTATLTPGTWTGDIGTTNVTATCNDPLGFAIYAIGYSNNSYVPTDLGSNTDLIYSNSNASANTSTTTSTTIDTITADITNNISTNTNTSGNTSGWSMNLGKSSDSNVVITPTPTDYSNYAPVPSTYAKVATYTNGTTTGGAESSFNTTYGAYISPTQAPGTYTGAVRYTLVHPNNAIPQPTYYMQDFTIGQCEVLANNGPIEVVDKRDNEVYKVQYLKDGNCWMLDNLRLGSNDYEIPLSPLDTNIKEPWVLPKGITEGFLRYNEAQVNATYKNDTNVTSYGLGSGKIGTYYNYCAASGGTYCYGQDAGIGNAEYDVCPSGWRLPTGGENGEYQNLYANYGNTPELFRNAFSATLSGYFSDYGHNTSVGRFWSSTHFGNSRAMYALGIDSYIYPSSNYYRFYGFSVRCLAKNE